MSVLNKAICLRLNALWQPIGYCTVKAAVIAMNGMPDGTPPAMALDITLGEDGRLVKAIPTSWEDWVNLHVGDSEPAIASSSRPIRAPLILLDPNYNKMPVKAPKLTNEAIHERDGLVDQYTGEQLTRDEATVDHVIPKDVWRKRGLKGSPNRFDNMVTCRNVTNFQKGNKTNRQAGLNLLKKPKVPKAVPVAVLHKPRLPAHKPFFSHRDE